MSPSQLGYATYYTHQLGNGLDIYSGRVGQRGHGLGGMLSGLLRGITPMFKSIGSSIGKTLLHTGLNVARDISSGSSLSHSLKRRGKQAGLDILKRGVGSILTDNKPPKKKTKRRKPKTGIKIQTRKTQKRTGKKRTKQDIFGGL